MSRFSGVYANLPTPFDDTGDALDIHRMKGLIDFLLERRIHGVACLLSSGEYPYLSQAERQTVAREVVRHVAKRVPVIVGVSALTTKEAILFAKHAEDAGADAVMVMPIQYWTLRKAEVINYFKAISRQTSLPIGIYDNPGLGGAKFTADMYRTLMVEANAQLSKDSSGNIQRVTEVVRACGPGVSILHGNHMEMLPAYLLGAAGVCTAMASVFPEACLEMHELAIVRKDWSEARRRFEDLAPLFRFCQEHALSRCVKDASELMGRPLGAQRPPLTGLDPDERRELSGLLREQGYRVAG
ncbi:MAG: dihydrodipicolinate synthase family protein [Burkholderiales bacterium]|nr:dihydrodipicolinate synthase family protein [Burkholderiales bacterium]